MIKLMHFFIKQLFENMGADWWNARKHQLYKNTGVFILITWIFRELFLKFLNKKTHLFTITIVNCVRKHNLK